jgi:glycosyltransferase domain-containing protein
VSGPRVTVGIPTYDRADGLERALASVLAQTHAELRVVIADNASTDATAEVCARAAAADARVRVVRRPENVGLTANFNGLLSTAETEFVMVLADDDWLDPGYLERCLARLDADPGLVLVSGRAEYHGAAGDARGPGVDVDCAQAEPAERVAWWFGHVRDNASIYGVTRSAALRACLPMPNTLAGDWLLLGRLLMHGRLATEPAVAVHRTIGGTSADYERTVRSMGLTRREAALPHLAIASLIRRDVGPAGHPAYAPLGDAARRRLARRSAAAMLRARPLDLAADLARPLRALPGAAAAEERAREAVRRRRGERPYVP